MITLGDYMSWIESIGGEATEGIGKIEDIGMVPKMVLKSPDGFKVVHKNTKREEYLPRSGIEYFNRRLQVESEFQKSKLKNKMPKY